MGSVVCKTLNNRALSSELYGKFLDSAQKLYVREPSILYDGLITAELLKPFPKEIQDLMVVLVKPETSRDKEVLSEKMDDMISLLDAYIGSMKLSTEHNSKVLSLIQVHTSTNLDIVGFAKCVENLVKVFLKSDNDKGKET